MVSNVIKFCLGLARQEKAFFSPFFVTQRINTLDQEEKFYMLMIEDLSLVNIIIKMFWYQEEKGNSVFMINKDDKQKDM